MRKRPVQARSRMTVEAILDATARILVRDGYSRLTTNAVAEQAGVSIGSLYQYFPDKVALVEALHARHLERRQQEIVGAMDLSLKGIELPQIRRLVAGIVNGHLVEPALDARFEALRHEAVFADRLAVRAPLDDFRRSVERLIDAALGQPRQGSDTALSATVLIETIHALAMMATTAPSGPMRERIIDEAARMVVGYLGALSTAAPSDALLDAGCPRGY